MYNHEKPSKSNSSGRASAGTSGLASVGQYQQRRENFLFYLAFLMTIGALLLNQAQALSLISEKCDPNKVGPDETTVKGGWQAEMFNGLSFRACG